jgi:hypothetical protein
MIFWSEVPLKKCIHVVGIFGIYSTCSSSLRAGSLDEREPARIPITFTCMRPIFGRRALTG